jgi:hypothetical protein
MEGAVDLLQLALNCSSESTRDKAVRHLRAPDAANRTPELLEPDVARRLVVTAARRQHYDAVYNLVSNQRLAYITQHIDAATLEVILFELQNASDTITRSFLQLPAAEHLSSEAVFRVLLQAAARDAGCVNVLCELSLAQQFGKAAVLQLLHAAVKNGYMPSPICRLPAAQQLSSAEVYKLLQAAVQSGMSDFRLRALLIIPSARQLASQGVLQLLEAAVKRGDHDSHHFSIRPLCALPAARQLSKEAVAGLLQTVEELGGGWGNECAAVLRALPGA